ncbi:MAG: hypothetical protein IJ899_03620 [Blautia sp.]|nr:hypothetical protein [Blautia sp.]
MYYHIEAQSKRRIRVRLRSSKLTEEEARILEYAFSGMPGVTKVTVYRATGGCALEFNCRVDEILGRLDRFRFENVEAFAREEEKRISLKEMESRKLDEQLKAKLRLRILAETAADIALPMPVQIGYHLWQMITLKKL